MIRAWIVPPIVIPILIGFGLGEARGRRRQVDNGLEFEPVAHRVRVRW